MLQVTCVTGYVCYRLHVLHVTCVTVYLCYLLHMLPVTCVTGYLCYRYLCYRYLCYRLLVFQVTCEGTDRSFNLDWERVRLFDKEVAQMFVGIIKSADNAR